MRLRRVSKLPLWLCVLPWFVVILGGTFLHTHAGTIAPKHPAGQATFDRDASHRPGPSHCFVCTWLNHAGACTLTEPGYRPTPTLSPSDAAPQYLAVSGAASSHRSRAPPLV